MKFKRVHYVKIMSNMIKMPEGVEYIIKKLYGSGFPAHAVGGCVRDSLLGREPSDWDVATLATPADISRIFRGKPIIPTGIKHGTVTIIINKIHYEVTTYRIDGAYTDGRRPDAVSFTDNLREDLARRDFTVNAMAYNYADGLVDCFGGADDLREKTIRCVGRAKDRFSEDYLRMLRAYRFAAVLGFSLDGELLESARAAKDKITNISAERIRVEFDKLMLSGNFDVIRMFLDDFRCVLFPELSLQAYERCIPALENTPPQIEIRIGALFLNAGATHGESSKIAYSILKRLKYDNETIARVTEMIRGADISPDLGKIGVKRLINRFGFDGTLRLLTLLESCAKGEDDNQKLAHVLESLELRRKIAEAGEPCAVKDLALTGNEVMTALGCRPGKEVGEALSFLTEEVIAAPELNTPEALLDVLKLYKNKRGMI